ncbi:hypothetical protein IWQ60_006406 [Tieghemiomyces parasiticus]|uniref:Uncharacterized protein n=1 Tax=Tieghemiomyces parasiticus TaxID=78921 RepID=A0A9W8A7B8_9FUNG|nr:hypothetical protein IWQ60_006406 [Tieghemiomyces parasiticus]
MRLPSGLARLNLPWMLYICLALFTSTMTQADTTAESPLTSPPASGVPAPPIPPPPVAPPLESDLYHCESVGVCQPCTDDEIASPVSAAYCAATGRKQAVRCQWLPHVPVDRQNPELLPTYQPCNQVRSVSRWAFFRFQFLNVFIAILSCMILIWRRRVVRNQKYRRMGPRGGRV